MWKAFKVEQHGTDPGYTEESGSHQMSAMAGSSKNRPHGLYTRYEDDEEAAVSNSQENIINRDDKFGNEIRVEKSYAVSTRSVCDDEERTLPVPEPSARSHSAKIVR